MSWKDRATSVTDNSDNKSSWKNRATSITSEENTGPSEAESFLGGVQQGGTLGYADEIGAGVQSLADKLYSGLGLGAVSDVDAELTKQGFKLPNEGKSVYEQARDENRAETKRLEEANPMSSMAGNLVGGLVTTGSIGSGAAKTLTKEGLKKAAPQLLKAGATVGGIEAAGRSEADNLADLAKDTAIGAGVGAGTSVAIPLAGQYLAKIPGAVGNTVSKTAKAILPENYSKDVTDAYNLGKRGLKVFGDEAKETLQHDINKTANQIKEAAKGKFDNASKELGNILEKASENKNFADFAGVLEEDILNDPNISTELKNYAAKQFNLLKNKTTTTETISGEQIALDRLNKNMEKLRGKQDLKGQAYEQFYADPTDEGNFIQAVNARLDPKGTKEVGRSVLQSAIPEDKVVTNVSKEFKDISLSDLNRLAGELNSAAASTDDMLLKAEYQQQAKTIKAYIAQNLSQEEATAMGYLNSEMRDIHRAGNIDSALARKQHTNPDVDLDLQKLVTSTNGEDLNRIKQLAGLGSEIPKQIDDIRLRQNIAKLENKNTNFNLNPMSWLPSKIKVVKTANYIGNLKNADSTNIMNIADKLAARGSKYASKVQGLVSNPNKNKILFVLSQQPEFRKEIEDILKEENQN